MDYYQDFLFISKQLFNSLENIIMKEPEMNKEIQE